MISKDVEKSLSLFEHPRWGGGDECRVLNLVDHVSLVRPRRLDVSVVIGKTLDQTRRDFDSRQLRSLPLRPSMPVNGLSIIYSVMFLNVC
jgi:hypothetical protein